MKAQSKPAAQLVKPGGAAISPDQSEGLRELMEANAASAVIEQKRNKEMGKIAQMLSATYKVTDFTWPFLRYQNNQTSVSEYYPDLKIAVDKFYAFDEWEISLVDFKKKVLGENGVKYGYLTPDMDLVDLAIQLGISKEEDLRVDAA